MFDSEFLRNILEAKPGEYISVQEVADRRFLETVFAGLLEEDPRFEASEETIAYFVEITSHIYMKFASGDREDLLSIDPDDKLQDRVEEVQNEIVNQIYDNLADRATEDFPILVDIFQVRGIVFAYEVTEKEETLSNLMDRLVEEERYEEAAKVRDALEEIGSDKVKI